VVCRSVLRSIHESRVPTTVCPVETAVMASSSVVSAALAAVCAPLPPAVIASVMLERGKDIGRRRPT
jgi:hypothetical protein